MYLQGCEPSIQLPHLRIYLTMDFLSRFSINAHPSLPLSVSPPFSTFIDTGNGCAYCETNFKRCKMDWLIALCSWPCCLCPYFDPDKVSKSTSFNERVR